MAFCTACGGSLVEGTAACSSCTKGQRICARCGAANPPLGRFCGACGTPLPAPADARAPGSERREVTVVFADAVNFTAASNAVDSESIYLFVDEAMRLLADVVTRHEGTVDKFTGDGLMALFGAPRAHEDDAERAVRAAWEMQQVVASFRERLFTRHGFDFRIRIGVNTGDVVAGALGSSTHVEYTVIGDAVNLASRLQTAAEPDTVLVHQTTYERTFWNIDYEAIAPLTLKGIREPVQAWRVKGVRPRARQRRGLDGVVVPLIGRAQPLADLVSACCRMSEQRALHVAVITGEAGVGKSRLSRELRNSIDPASARVVEAVCTAMSRSRPLALAADLVRALLDCDDRTPPETQRAALDGALRGAGGDETALAPYLEALLELPSTHDMLAQDEAILQQQTHAAVRRLLVRAARVQPLVVVLDDLHWIDAASRELLDYAIRSVRDEPMLFVLIARSLDSGSVARPLVESASRTVDAVVEVPLPPLHASHARVFVSHLIRDDTALDRAVQQKILERSGGNPFYIEELVRMLVERGVLQGDPGAWRATAAAVEAVDEIPGGLRGLVLARFDTLPAAARRVLQIAAVIGRWFPQRLLHEVAAEDARQLETIMEDLASRAFVDREDSGAERGYAFRHVLVQEAIQSTLLRRDRGELHERIAEVIAAGRYWSELEQDDVLAFHFGEGAHPERALPYLIAAAEYASRRQAHETVVQRCTRALQHLDASSPGATIDIARVEILRGRALKFLGRLAASRSILRAAAARVAGEIDQGDTAAAVAYAELLRELVDVQSREGMFDAASADLDKAVALVEDHPVGAALRHSVRERAAWLRFRQGRLQEALEIAQDLERAMSAGEADPITLASVCNTIGGVLWQRGDLDGAARYVHRSLELYEQVGYYFGQANAHTNLGVLQYAQGRWAEAVISLERSDRIQRDAGSLVGRAANLLNLAVLRLTMGQHAQARRDYAASLEVSRQLGEESDAAHALLGLAHLAVIESRLDDAESALGEVRRAEGVLTDDEKAQWQSYAALVACARGNVSEAGALAAAAVALTRGAGVNDALSDCLRIAGTIQSRAGDVRAAAASLIEAQELARATGDPYRTALAAVELAALPAAERPESAVPLEEAMAILTHLGAEHDLSRARALGTLVPSA